MVVDAVQRELEGLPRDLADSGLAALALACAENIDAARPGSTPGAMWAQRLQDALRELRALAPPKTEKDRLDDLAARRAKRRRRAAATG